MRRYALTMRFVLAAGLALIASVPPARGQDVPDGFIVETLVPNLATPVAFDFLPDGRVLFAEQFTAQVRLIRTTYALQATPVITVPGVTTSGGERGLLGIAVDPAFPARPYLYVHHTATSAHVRIARYTLTGDLDGTSGADLVADPASRYDLIDDAPDNAPNHNGGTVRFGIESVLYASLGEDANMCAAQTPGTLRGVMLRMRTFNLPPGPGAAFRAQLTDPANPFATSPDSNLRLVAAYGLRNPFRFQVDPLWGTLAIGDVGATLREELDLLSPTLVFPGAQGVAMDASPLGANFGWPFREGTVDGPGGSCGTPPAGLVEPVYDYDRTQQNGASIISAGFYRPHTGGVFNWPADHDGDLFANDYYSGVLRRIKQTGGVWSLADPIPGQPDPAAWGTGFDKVSDWRLAADGSLWFCRQSVNYIPLTGSLGRIRGPGLVSTPPGARLSLKLTRSPAVGVAELRVVADANVRVRIVDLAGRPIRTLWEGIAPAAQPGDSFLLTWDGTAEDGDRARPGMYLAFVESGGRRASVRIPFLR